MFAPSKSYPTADTLSLVQSLEMLLYGNVSEICIDLMDRFNQRVGNMDKLTEEIFLRHESLVAEAEEKYESVKRQCIHKQRKILEALDQFGDILPEELTFVELVDMESCVNVFAELSMLTHTLDDILIHVTCHKIHENKKAAAKVKSTTTGMNGIGVVVQLFKEK